MASLKSPYLVKRFLELAAQPVYANTTATLAVPESLGRQLWPEANALHPELAAVSKRLASGYVPYDGMTISRSAWTGLFVVESITAKTDLSELSRDILLLSTDIDSFRHPVRYASGAWKQMPDTNIWMHIRNAGDLFGPGGEYGFVRKGTAWDAPWHVETTPSSSNASDWEDLKAWWDRLARPKTTSTTRGRT